MIKSSPILDSLITVLPVLSDHHDPGCETYRLLKMVARREIESLFSDPGFEPRSLKPFGEVVMPYFKMGAIDSLNLFDLDELIIFAFYWANRERYKKVLDIGANIGLHSIMLSKCGYEVRSFEPDPRHFELLNRNLKLNNCDKAKTLQAAVSNKSHTAEFIRVLGNTTSSHIAGSKANPYGELERFPVKVEDIKDLIEWPDLLKIDAEGQEKEILLSIGRGHWLKKDALIEVGNEENAKLIFDHFKNIKINLFSQKINWKQVDKLEDMPKSHHDGTLFASGKNEVPWG